MAEYTLNSNLILLIHLKLRHENDKLYPLNSNLILLIRKRVRRQVLEMDHFKFQSDSINTLTPLCKVLPQNALNSNLILLILAREIKERDVHFPLNSNLILLIRMNRFMKDVWASSFKFQSDSINTMIPTKVGGGSTTFKFQSDSINTLYGQRRPKGLYGFKFQSDSINTS